MISWNFFLWCAIGTSLTMLPTQLTFTLGERRMLIANQDQHVSSRRALTYSTKEAMLQSDRWRRHTDSTLWYPKNNKNFFLNLTWPASAAISWSNHAHFLPHMTTNTTMDEERLSHNVAKHCLLYIIKRGCLLWYSQRPWYKWVRSSIHFQTKSLKLLTFTS